MVEAAGRERAALAAAARSQVEDAHAEADALRRLIKLKTRELKHVRRLAHEVLLQRSNVEIFLLSSLQQVGHRQGRRVEGRIRSRGSSAGA